MTLLTANPSKQISSFMLLAIILIEGYVTISVEILTIRQLLPVAGSNVVVTSLIIGIFLLFLAYGYRKGGTYTADHLLVLRNNFLKAALWLGVGLCYYFIAWFFYFFDAVLHQSLIVTLLLYLLLVTAPLVYVLGQTVPLVCHLCNENDNAAILSSKILHLSTLGSFLGSIFTTVVLMNYLGVAWTVFIDFLLLIGLALIGFSQRKMLQLILLMCATIIIYVFNVTAENNIFVRTNSYANYQVYDDFALSEDNHGKLLLINNSASSFNGKNNKGFSYIETIKKILFQDLKLHNKNILVLGSGGFSLSAENAYQNHFTYVDIDSKIYSLVKNNFSNNINGEFVAEDARVYVKNTPHQYDVIVSDAYNNKVVIPHHLLTKEHFLNIRQKLVDSGYAVFNIAATPTLDDAYSRKIDATIRAVFPACMAIPEQYTNQLSNIIYICKKTHYDAQSQVYRDNLNSATFDAYKGLNA